MKRFAVLCKMEIRLFVRDFFSCFFTLVFPVMMLLLFGSIFQNAPLYEGAGMRMMDVSVPAYTVMIIGVSGLMSLPLTLAGYKEKKIYKRFDATPLGKRWLMTAQVTVHLLMTLLGIMILILVGLLVYQIQIKGSLLSICFGLLLSVVALFSMGFLFTAIGRDLKSTTLLCYLFYFIMLFLSGATIPDVMFPDMLKKIADCLPMTYAVDLMQGLCNGEHFAQHGTELLVLGVATLLFTTIGSFLYRNKDWT